MYLFSIVVMLTKTSLICLLLSLLAAFLVRPRTIWPVLKRLYLQRRLVLFISAVLPINMVVLYLVAPWFAAWADVPVSTLGNLIYSAVFIGPWVVGSIAWLAGLPRIGS